MRHLQPLSQFSLKVTVHINKLLFQTTEDMIISHCNASKHVAEHSRASHTNKQPPCPLLEETIFASMISEGVRLFDGFTYDVDTSSCARRHCGGGCEVWYEVFLKKRKGWQYQEQMAMWTGGSPQSSAGPCSRIPWCSPRLWDNPERRETEGRQG